MVYPLLTGVHVANQIGKLSFTQGMHFGKLSPFRVGDCLSPSNMSRWCQRNSLEVDWWAGLGLKFNYIFVVWMLWLINFRGLFWWWYLWRTLCFNFWNLSCHNLIDLYACLFVMQLLYCFSGGILGILSKSDRPQAFFQVDNTQIISSTITCVIRSGFSRCQLIAESVGFEVKEKSINAACCIGAVDLTILLELLLGPGLELSPESDSCGSSHRR